MKDEIKEILDNTLEYLEGIDETRNIKILTTNETNILLDYITNLQEENERLKEQCKEWKENHKAVCIQRDNILNNIVKDTEDRIDYKSRNEKAIEYIEEQSDYISSKSGTYYMCYAERNIVLDILKGGDEE